MPISQVLENPHFGHIPFMEKWLKIKNSSRGYKIFPDINRKRHTTRLLTTTLQGIIASEENQQWINEKI